MDEIQDYEYTEIAASSLGEGSILLDPEDGTLHRITKLVVVAVDAAGRPFAFSPDEQVTVV